MAMDFSMNMDLYRSRQEIGTNRRWSGMKHGQTRKALSLSEQECDVGVDRAQEALAVMEPVTKTGRSSHRRGGAFLALCLCLVPHLDTLRCVRIFRSRSCGAGAHGRARPPCLARCVMMRLFPRQVGTLGWFCDVRV